MYLGTNKAELPQATLRFGYYQRNGFDNAMQRMF